jgi:anti-sigma B factor antagonist
MNQHSDSRDVTVAPLALDRSGTQPHPVVAATGEIDVATSPQLRDELNRMLANGPESITVDFENVTFIDSSGLGVLVGALKKVRERNGTIQVVHAQDAVRKVFDITGLDGLFDLRD